MKDLGVGKIRDPFKRGAICLGRSRVVVRLGKSSVGDTNLMNRASLGIRILPQVILEALAPFSNILYGGRIKRLRARSELVEKEVVLGGKSTKHEHDLKGCCEGIVRGSECFEVAAKKAFILDRSRTTLFISHEE
jgi:hypothetical protein